MLLSDLDVEQVEEADQVVEEADQAVEEVGDVVEEVVMEVVVGLEGRQVSG